MIWGRGRFFQWRAFRPGHAFHRMVLVRDGVSWGFPAPRIGVLLRMGTAWHTAATLRWGSPESWSIPPLWGPQCRGFMISRTHGGARVVLPPGTVLSDQSQTRAFHAFINSVLLSKYPSLFSLWQCSASQMDGRSSSTTCQKQARPQQPSMKLTKHGCQWQLLFLAVLLCSKSFPLRAFLVSSLCMAGGHQPAGAVIVPTKPAVSEVSPPLQGTSPDCGKWFEGKNCPS